MRYCLVLLCAVVLPALRVLAEAPDFGPGVRSLVEAHNCYPYGSFWADRMDRALAQPRPLAIEIDLRWQKHPETGEGRLIVAHDEPPAGFLPPTFQEYVLDAIKPIVEEALASEDRSDWPIITLNVNDLRGSEREMYEALWRDLGQYEDWYCTAEKSEDPALVAPLTPGPVLVLSNGSDTAREVFYDSVPVGGKLRVFGRGSPQEPATNFRRWVNYQWNAVEAGGQRNAGDWTEEDARKLEALVKQSHEMGYWLRVYTLNGHDVIDIVRNGWSPNYNFGSLEAVQLRWRAAIEAGVDFVPTDQYEEAGKFWPTVNP